MTKWHANTASQEKNLTVCELDFLAENVHGSTPKNSSDLIHWNTSSCANTWHETTFASRSRKKNKGKKGRHGDSSFLVKSQFSLFLKHKLLISLICGL